MASCIIRWSFGLLVLCCLPLVVSGQEGLLAQGRTGFVNQLITDLMAPFQTRVGSSEMGVTAVKLKDLTVHDPKSGQLVLSIKEALWSPAWTALAGGDYGELSLRGVQVLVTAETEAAVAAWLKPSGKPSTGGVRFSKILLTDAQLRLRPTQQMPALECQVDGMLRGLDTRQQLVMEQVQLSLKKLRIQPLEATQPAVEMPAWALDASLTAAGRLIIQQLQLPELSLHWSRQLEGYFPSGNKAADTTAPLVKSLLVKQCQIGKAKLSCTSTELLPYEAKLELATTLHDLEWDGQRLSSAQLQKLELRALSAAHHPRSRGKALAPFALLQEGKLSLVPDDWMRQQRVETCVLVAPQVSWKEELMPWLKQPPTSATAKVATTAPAAAQQMQLHFGQLSVKQGRVDYAALLGERVEFSTQLEVDATVEQMQRFSFKEMSLSVPARSPLPVARVPELVLVAALPALWRNYEVQSLMVKGGAVEVGDALAALTTAESEAVAEPPSPWLVKEVVLEDTTMTLQRVAPGLPPVKFAIDFAAKDLPLSLSRMRGRTERLSVELSQLAIRSPYESLREVARLPNSFVEFTLDGLARRRIDQVKIVSPTLFIGEDLFWYIDYYRKYAAGEDVSDFHKKVAVALASVVPQDALVAAAMQETAAAESSSGGWSIGTLEVHSGKLVLAPKGYPLPGIPRPFPFSFVSHMDHGRIEAEFEIPSDDYTWAPIQLKLEGLSGKVQFNLPLKDRSNNLTEVFRVKRIRYKKLHVEDAHLSVTYDANGIYGQFGGEAYEGYVKGAFNVYMGKGYPWDGWITGTGVRSTEITQQMCPAYFLLDGKVDVSVILNGDEKSVFQTDLKFSNQSPGRFSVTALNEMLACLPGDWPGYMRDATRIGIETLRDFPYDSVSSEARFYGRSGKGFMRFKGPTGSRNIDVNLHDLRSLR